MKFNLDIKKFVILIIALVALFIPTYLAIGNYYANQQQPRTKEFTELDLKIPDGTSATFKKDDDDGMLASFLAMNKGGEAVDSLPADYSGESFLLGTFRRENGEEVNYKYYFSADSDKCFFADPDGKVFRIAKSDALKFFDTKYSLYLFKSATTPVLTVAGDSKVEPTSISWNYLVNGIYRNITDDKPGSTSQSFDVANDPGIKFDIAPTQCTVKVYNASGELFSGAPETLSELKIEKNDTLTFKIEANWEQTDGCEYYGKASYEFSANVSAAAIFTLGENKVDIGNFVVLSGLNVTDPSKIVFKSEPSIGCMPQFFTDGDYVRAVVPIYLELAPAVYKLTVSYGLTTQTLDLTVSDKTFTKSYAYYDVPKSVVDASYSAEDIAEYRKLITEICSTNESMKYFSDKFLNYEDNKIGIAIGFGKHMLMRYADDFRHEGVDYVFNLGAEIPAMNSGKVVYVGTCDILGKFVVVDHGMGLKSWYAHMSEASVSVGDMVNKGQTIGKVGKTGFVTTHRLHVMITANGVPVSPYPLQDNGLIY